MATVRRERNGGRRSRGWLSSLVRGREVLVQGYGETAKGNGQEPDGRSLLRLGSISKVFATELLAAMAAEG
jgi:D-alanyl-D-alanine-carboxypeptidase/D-alanyl-D-alanine-endopeptidase